MAWAAWPNALPLHVLLILLSSSFLQHTHLVRAATWQDEYPFIKDSASFDDSVEFDFIVVGGGTSGCPLAATLSKSFSVLVLERGHVPFDQVRGERQGEDHGPLEAKTEI